jgi:hypothetical protein
MRHLYTIITTPSTERLVCSMIGACAAAALALGVVGSSFAGADPTAPPLPAAAQPVVCPAGGKDVHNAAELRRALAAAQPGDVIRLADGAYLAGDAGNFEITASGRPDAPIFLCGSKDPAGAPRAWLDGTKDPNRPDPEHKRGASYVLHLDGASWWRLVDFGVRNGRKGVMADRATHDVLSGLSVRGTGDEAVHLRDFSTDNTVTGVTVRDTGHRRPKFGEGLYVGSAQSNWCTISDCQPDRSDRNVLVGNDVAGTSAESIDIKEGTVDGVVAGNVLSGAGMQKKGADSWIDVKGNGWTVKDNVGTDSPNDGVQVHVILRGWGKDNTIVGNRLAVNGPGYGVYVQDQHAGNVVCDNAVVGAKKGASNIPCSPRPR